MILDYKEQCNEVVYQLWGKQGYDFIILLLQAELALEKEITEMIDRFIE